MEALLKVMAAKKRDISIVQAEKAQSKEKYLRKAEVETLLASKLQQEEAQNKAGSAVEAALSADDAGTALKKRKLESGDAQQQQKQEPETTAEKQEQQDESEETIRLPWNEMKQRLRERGQPITLFGESERDRMTRLQRAEHDAAVRNEDKLSGGHERRNRTTQEDDDEAFADHKHGEHEGGGNAAGSSGKSGDRADKEDDEEDENDPDKLTYRFFKNMLQLWERDLAERPDHVKRTAQGKIATKTMKQCKDYIRPLFKLCKMRAVPSDIGPNLVEIVKFCKQGEFVMANDAYIKLAIGNAAWPIGVTMVGIHERTGREKINSNKQAHVMNNEAQRKYLTSVKRLISYAQSIANVLPSKRVS